MKVPWTARGSNKSILKEINPEYSLEGLVLKLKLQYFTHLMQRVGSSEKTPMLGKSEGNENGVTEDEVVGWHHYSMHMFVQAPGDIEGEGSLVCCSSWGHNVSDMTD